MRQIGGDALRPRKNETLKATVERDIKKRKLQKKYDALEKKVWRTSMTDYELDLLYAKNHRG